VPNLLSLVLVQLSSRSEWDVRKEATWVISNAITAGDKRHIAHLVELGVVAPLCELLDVGEGRVLLIAMVNSDIAQIIFNYCQQNFTHRKHLSAC